MQEAAPRDQIARLYVTGYEDLFARALPIWRQSLQRWRSKEWAATAIFLSTLAAQPDSLIARKFGVETSNAVSKSAQTLWPAFESARDPNEFRNELVTSDIELKEKGLNPGTTADITVATIFIAGLQDRC
jgi:triphosphoribosyl-dephospho-CoA synthase